MTSRTPTANLGGGLNWRLPPNVAEHGRALVRLLRDAWREYERDYARYFAGAMVYYALVSLIPVLLLVLATLALLLRVSSVAAAAEQQVLQAVESSLGPETRLAIDKLLERLQAGSIVAIAVSLVGLLITAAAFFKHLRISFRALWKHEAPLASGSVRGVVRETLAEQIKAFMMVLTAGVLMVLTLGFIAVVHWLSSLFSAVPRLTDAVGWLLALPISFLLATLIFGLLFMFLPPVPLRWRQVRLASMLCGFAWIIGAELLALYASFGETNPYGAIGGVFVVMLWMQYVIQVLFYGAEVCKVMATRPAQPA
ncbi:MAG TPA: YihY/virulence factor BrkB family protein [Vicinamibacterales bacterium]